MNKSKVFLPCRGQRGKDICWVPTQEVQIKKSFDMIKLNKKDYLIDLGSGDGRIAIEAGKRGAKALGVDANPHMTKLSITNAVVNGVGDRVDFINGDLFDVDLSKATVITMFLYHDINLKLKDKLKKLRDGVKIISHCFPIFGCKEDDYHVFDQKYNQEHYIMYPGIYVYVTPLKTVSGFTIGKRKRRYYYARIDDNYLVLRCNNNRIPTPEEVKYSVELYYRTPKNRVQYDTVKMSSKEEAEKFIEEHKDQCYSDIKNMDATDHIQHM